MTVCLFALSHVAFSQTIQGPDYYCDTTCYQLLNAPTGSTINWIVYLSPLETGNLQIISGQGTSYVCIAHNVPSPISKGNSDSDGRGIPGTTSYIRAAITHNGTTTTVTKNLRHPQGQTPTISASNSTNPWVSGTTRNFSITNCSSASNSDLEWVIMKIINYSSGPDTTFTYDVGRTTSYTPTIPSGRLGSVTVTAINTGKECGDNSASLTFGLCNTSKSLLVNIDNNQLDIFIQEDGEGGQKVVAQLDGNKEYVLELWHNLYGRLNAKFVNSANVQMNIEGLASGVYVLVLKENNKVISQTKVQIQ